MTRYISRSGFVGQNFNLLWTNRREMSRCWEAASLWKNVDEEASEPKKNTAGVLHGSSSMTLICTGQNDDWV